jgi:hypothetical protein
MIYYAVTGSVALFLVGVLVGRGDREGARNWLIMFAAVAALAWLAGCSGQRGGGYYPVGAAPSYEPPLFDAPQYDLPAPATLLLDPGTVSYPSVAAPSARLYSPQVEQLFDMARGGSNWRSTPLR